ncbi:MAG: hypothetical protein DHS20C01_33570 [marine bacterium B5-7]|nr:MAG: hypothetical protein DHS20C01_33570 [marine bacterium B5-7]
MFRSLALAGGVITGPPILYGWINGVRFPILQFEPPLRPQRLDLQRPSVVIDLTDAYLQEPSRQGDGLALTVRAFSPHPKVVIEARQQLDLDIIIRNLSPRAELEPSSGISIREESLTKINRRLQMTLPVGRHVIRYGVPFENSFSFTAIGDSGSSMELGWCLERSHQLGADFMLHTGDFFYSNNDPLRLPGILDESPLPVYAAIGNHDFSDNGRFLADDFTYIVGPRNYYFRLGDTAIVSFDTGASTWPVGGADRHLLFTELEQLKSDVRHWVLMTHRPLHDPLAVSRYEEPHTLSNREIKWVIEKLVGLTPAPVLLTGHIHISAGFEEDGIKTYITGMGLASGNLVSGRAVARILQGEKIPGQGVSYKWQPLNMPVRFHCHEKNASTVKSAGKIAPEGSFGESCPKEEVDS